MLAHAIYVPEPPSFLRGFYPPADQVIEHARRGADLRLRELSASLGARRVWPEVRVGRPDEVLPRVGEEFGAELLVVGPHGERPGVWRLLGGTAERIARRATMSVLLARDVPAGGPETVLVALDESELTRAVIDWAARCTAATGAKAVVIHVANQMMHGAVLTAASERERRRAEEQIRQGGEEWLREQLAGTPLDRARIEVAFGHPGFAILGEMERFGANLLVIGRGGVSHAGRTQLGSAAEFLLRNGAGPVLVVAAPPGRPPAAAAHDHPERAGDSPSGDR